MADKLTGALVYANGERTEVDTLVTIAEELDEQLRARSRNSLEYHIVIAILSKAHGERCQERMTMGEYMCAAMVAAQVALEPNAEHHIRHHAEQPRGQA